MSINILVVDDKEENRYTLKSLLEEYEDDVIIHLASDGEEALRIVLGKVVDIIILDIHMPGMDGFEVAELIKNNPKTKYIPILFLTAAFKSEEFRKRGFEIGAVDYLTKPVEDYQLINKVNLYVNMHRQKMELKKINKNLEKVVKDRVEELRKKDKILIQQSKMAAMGEAIGIIAHQWKQPLNALSVTIQGLEEAYEFDEIDKKFIDETINNAMSQVSYMANTIDDFKNFFNPNKKKKEISIKKIIQNAFNILNAQTFKEFIDIQVVGEDVVMDGYENELQQVILNIINNAKDALIENKIENKKIEITITKNKSKKVEIIICDNAGGIPDAIIDNIFEPHFTTKGDSGTGIGLYMVKMIVDDSFNGKVNVENIDGGACFKIVL